MNAAVALKLPPAHPDAALISAYETLKMLWHREAELLAESARLEATLSPEIRTGPGFAYSAPCYLPARLRAQWEREYAEKLKPLDRLYDEVWNAADDIERQILDMPAHTLDGIAIKIRLMERSCSLHEQDPDDEDPLPPFQRKTLDSILADINRLSGPEAL